jgi:hypothetical protein
MPLRGEQAPDLFSEMLSPRSRTRLKRAPICSIAPGGRIPATAVHVGAFPFLLAPARKGVCRKRLSRGSFGLAVGPSSNAGRATGNLSLTAANNSGLTVLRPSEPAGVSEGNNSQSQRVCVLAHAKTCLRRKAPLPGDALSWSTCAASPKAGRAPHSLGFIAKRFYRPFTFPTDASEELNHPRSPGRRDRDFVHRWGLILTPGSIQLDPERGCSCNGSLTPYPKRHRETKRSARSPALAIPNTTNTLDCAGRNRRWNQTPPEDLRTKTRSAMCGVPKAGVVIPESSEPMGHTQPFVSRS